jgi:hypothetical protein
MIRKCETVLDICEMGLQECCMQRRPFSSSGVDVRDFIGKGAAAIAEIDRLADHTDPDDHRLKPLLKVIDAFPLLMCNLSPFWGENCRVHIPSN